MHTKGIITVTLVTRIQAAPKHCYPISLSECFQIYRRTILSREYSPCQTVLKNTHHWLTIDVLVRACYHIQNRLSYFIRVPSYRIQ
jgi:hypothetical protein